MNADHFLKTLASQARTDRAPRIDVTERVLSTVRGDVVASHVWTEGSRPFSLLCAASVLAASIAIAVGLYSHQTLHDPVLELVQSVRTEME